MIPTTKSFLLFRSQGSFGGTVGTSILSAGEFRTYLSFNNLRGVFEFVPSLEKNPDFFARYESVWCWTCGKVTMHEITWRWGGRCFLCKECATIVVEKL